MPASPRVEMSNYDTHKFLGLLPLPLVVVFLWMAYDGGFAEIEPLILFLVWWLLHTLVITPDIDTLSIPSKRLGPLGWIIRKLSKHRKTWHSPLFWAVYFGLSYNYLGWWTLGGVFPIYCHIYVDIITSWLNRRKIIKLLLLLLLTKIEYSIL